MKNKSKAGLVWRQQRNNVINRYTIHSGETDILLPTFATVVHVEGYQPSNLDTCVWLYVMVDLASVSNDMRKFLVVDTCQPIPERYTNYKYLGTTHTFVTKHAFEILGYDATKDHL